MLHSLFSRVSVIVTALFLAACGGSGDDGDTLPLATADEVKVAFDKAPRILPSVGVQVGPPPRFMTDPNSVEYRGVTSAGVPIVLKIVSTYRLAATSTVLVGWVFPPEIQMLPVSYTGYPDEPVAVRDIREYRDGWLIIYAAWGTYGLSINRWAMYRPITKEFIDCGELGSNREPSWGPPASSVCVRKN